LKVDTSLIFQIAIDLSLFETATELVFVNESVVFKKKDLDGLEVENKRHTNAYEVMYIYRFVIGSILQYNVKLHI
jgi:hypothetical protein